ncbi:MAG TPA: hypothetical protein VHJ59_01225, partial [Nitrososphaera sp.]|nr:hypothetical protein [Nitrososphaera sp.]
QSYKVLGASSLTDVTTGAPFTGNEVSGELTFVEGEAPYTVLRNSYNDQGQQGADPLKGEVRIYADGSIRFGDNLNFLYFDLTTSELVFNQNDTELNRVKFVDIKKQTQSSGGSGTGASGLTYGTINSAVTLEVNYRYAVDTSSGPLILTLPNDPVAGDEIALFDSMGTWKAQGISIHSDQKLIMGLAEDLTVDINYFKISLTFVNDARGWVIS